MKTISERLKYLFEYKGVTAYKVAKDTGITDSTLSRIIKKGNKPNTGTTTLLCKYFNVNETWLITGNGEIWKKDTVNEIAAHYKTTSEADRKLAISTFTKLLEETNNTIKALEVEPKTIKSIKDLREAHKLRLDILSDLEELNR